jgi:succinyl-CoA synthetase beta subunit
MDIHEYQAKELLSKFGVPIPRGGLAYSPEQATYRASELGGTVVVKAQIHSGARGKTKLKSKLQLKACLVANWSRIKPAPQANSSHVFTLKKPQTSIAKSTSVL